MNLASYKKPPLIFVIFCLLFLLVACNSDSEGQTKDEGSKTLTVALGHGLDYLGMDPNGSGKEHSTLSTVVFEPLVMETSIGTFEGALAESWEVDEAGTKWTFHLRENVTFHDGTPFKSTIVKETFLHYMEDPLLARRLGITTIDTPDDHTVIFNIQRPFAPFLNVISSFQCIIPSPSTFDENGNYVKAIGTGPFQLKSETKERLEFVAYEDHWRGKPEIDELVAVYIADPATMVLALESGEVDLIGADGYGVSYSEIQRLASGEQFTVVENADSSSLEWVGFNMYKEPLNDIRVRQAINYALNREEIAQYVYDGFATPAVGPIGFNDTIPWVDTSIKGYSFDVEKAQELLAEAGWTEKNKEGYLVKDGKVFELKFLIQPNRTWKPMGEVIQNQLKEIGIKVNLEIRDISIIRELVKKGDYDLAGLGSMGKSATDPYYFFQYYFTSIGTGTLVTDHEKLDQLIGQVVREVDENERQQIYNEIQHEVMDIVPGAFMVHPTRVTVMKEDISGWEFAGSMDPLRLIYKVSRD